jgi:hypothetical protein
MPRVGLSTVLGEEDVVGRPAGQTATEGTEQVRYLTEVEARALFDEAAHFCLGSSGDEFPRKWAAGEYDDSADRFPVMRVATMRYRVRSAPAISSRMPVSVPASGSPERRSRQRGTEL